MWNFCCVGLYIQHEPGRESHSQVFQPWLTQLTPTRMQEEILSRCLLVFFNGQVYYRCGSGSGTFSEAQNWPGESWSGPGLHVSLYFVLFRNDSYILDQFSSLITYNTSRTLGFQDDVLRACQGMLQKLAMLSGARSFEGLPAPLDQSLVFGLLNLRKEHVAQRQGFPSYS